MNITSTNLFPKIPIATPDEDYRGAAEGAKLGAPVAAAGFIMLGAAAPWESAPRGTFTKYLVGASIVGALVGAGTGALVDEIF